MILKHKTLGDVFVASIVPSNNKAIIVGKSFSAIFQNPRNGLWYIAELADFSVPDKIAQKLNYSYI